MQVQTRFWPQLLHCLHGTLRCPLGKAHALLSGTVTASEDKQLSGDLFLIVLYLKPTRTIQVFCYQQRLEREKAPSGAQEGPGMLCPGSPTRAPGCWLQIWRTCSQATGEGPAHGGPGWVSGTESC